MIHRIGFVAMIHIHKHFATRAILVRPNQTLLKLVKLNGFYFFIQCGVIFKHSMWLLIFFVVTDARSTVSPGTARKQKRSERDRIRYASMSIEKRTERNARHWELWHRKKIEGPSVGFNYILIIFVVYKLYLHCLVLPNYIYI